ncbi:MAG: hypothetical protein WCJ30_19980 [Deltaproteobacteria bacterium]
MLSPFRIVALTAAALSLAACTGMPVTRPPEDSLDVATDAMRVDALDAVDAVILACTATSLDWGGAADRMFPGSDCIGCHREGGSAARHVYTVAGTVFTAPDCPAGLAGATVHIDDAAGHSVDLPTNEVGNFYTDMHLVPPLHTRVTAAGVTAEMFDGATTGSCNTCHTVNDGGTGGWISPNPR